MEDWTNSQRLRRMEHKLDLIERRIGHVSEAVFVYFAVQLVLLVYLVGWAN